MKLKFNGFLALLLVLITQMTFAQDITVNGVVQDPTGLPIPGANVLVKGTTNGVQTDFDGKFQIKAAPGQVLVFSYLGMKTLERPASANMTVKLADDSVQLEGVVVTAFGIKRQKRELGYATASVNSKDLTEVTNTNAFESLSGKIAGVDITAPAQVGASSKVIIRGISSLNNQSPLYIVDGTPINNAAGSVTGNTRSFDSGNGIADVDPNNIESMTVLKGAAASALYGSRAAQGVIIITTKSAKNKQKLSVELSNSTDFSEISRVPHLQNQFGQGWAGSSFSNWASQPQNVVSNENGSWGPAFNGEVRAWGSIINDTQQQIKPYVGLENNIKDFYETGRTYTNNVRVFGGGENSNFSLNFTDVNSDGIIPTEADAYNRKTLGINAGMNTDKLSVKTSLNYVRKEQNAVNTGQGNDAGEGNTLIQEMLQVPRDISVTDLQDYTNNPFNTPSNFYTPYATNPYFVINENKTTVDGNRFYGNINLSYNFNKHLSLSYQAGGDYRMEKIKSYGAVSNYDPGSPNDAAGTPTVGGVTERSNEYVEFDTNLILNYNHEIGKDFNVNGLLGFNSNERKTDQLIASITNLDIPNYYELSNSSVKPQVIQNNIMQRSFSVFGSLEASWRNRIFLTVTGRNDWTSTLPQNSNSYFYPSASLSGIVLDTPDYFLKLRGGYAKLANDTGAYQTVSSLIPGSAFLGFGFINLPIGGVNGYEYSGNLGNLNLEPEIVKEFEVGFETNLFNKRVNLDASYYDKKTEGLLFQRPIAPSTGYLTQTANLLDLTNKGVELVLNVVPVRTENWNWDFTTTFTKNESEVTSIEGDVNKLQLALNYAVSWNAVVGQPLGVFMTTVPLQNAQGQYVVDPATGFYKVTADEQEIGNSQRDFVMGLKNKVSYKNLSFTFNLDWKEGGEMYSYTKRLSHFVGNGIETTYNDRNPFIIPNSVVEVVDVDGNVTGYEENTTPIGFASVTDYWNPQNNPGIEKGHVIDKTFVRLRDVALTYTFPSESVKRLGLTNASFTVYGKNLAMWTPDENPYIDPELSTFGVGLQSEVGEFGTNPSQRSFGASLKLTF